MFPPMHRHGHPFDGQNPPDCFPNAYAFSRRWHGREAALLQNQHAEAAHYDAARSAGDFDTAAVNSGECVGLISALLPAAKIVDQIAEQAEALLTRSNRDRTHAPTPARLAVA